MMYRRPQFEVRAYYAANPDKLALHTWNTDLLSRDMEIQAFLSRADIGKIQWRNGDGEWQDITHPA